MQWRFVEACFVRAGKVTVDNGQIIFSDGACLQLPRKCCRHFFTVGNNHQPSGGPVQTMNDESRFLWLMMLFHPAMDVVVIAPFTPLG